MFFFPSKTVHDVLKLLVVLVYVFYAAIKGILPDATPIWNSAVALCTVGGESLRRLYARFKSYCPFNSCRHVSDDEHDAEQ